MTGTRATLGKWFGIRLLGLRLGGDETLWLLPLLVAFSVYVAGLSGIGLLLAAESRRDAERGFAAAMTVEVSADTSAARLETVMALLKQTAGVLSAQVVDAKETARLLEPWLGPAPKLDELPVPKLIDLRTDADKAIDAATLRKHLATVMPEAQLDDHRQVLAAVRAAARRIEIVASAAIAAALLAIAAAATLATSVAFRTDRALIEPAHLLGAADADITRPLTLRALYLGLASGAGGGVAAAATVAALRGAGAILTIPASTAPTGIGDWRLWVILVACVLAAGLVAAACACVTVWRRLAEMP